MQWVKLYLTFFMFAPNRDKLFCTWLLSDKSLMIILYVSILLESYNIIQSVFVTINRMYV